MKADFDFPHKTDSLTLFLEVFGLYLANFVILYFFAFYANTIIFWLENQWQFYKKP